MNNTEGLLYKGRLLGCYFNGNKEIDFPRFALESEKEIGAKEVIDFKILRKEEVARRYFDYCCCYQPFLFLLLNIKVLDEFCIFLYKFTSGFYFITHKY